MIGSDRANPGTVYLEGNQMDPKRVPQSVPLPVSIINEIERVWKARAENVKGKGARLLNAQAEFFCGTMAMMTELAPHYVLPPRWVITIIAGHHITDLEPMV